MWVDLLGKPQKKEDFNAFYGEKEWESAYEEEKKVC
jgi:hypothetical protein